jgi:DNA polymerase
MSGYVGLDFETYAERDLTKVGLNNYVECPAFTPLLAAVAVEEQGVYTRHILDLTKDYGNTRKSLVDLLAEKIIVAHNAGFEQSVMKRMGMYAPASRFIDSAVLARAAGVAGKLEAAAPQLLGLDKVESGWSLIKKFSIPGEYQEENDNGLFDPQIVEDNPDDWAEFAYYCGMDAELSLRIAGAVLPTIPESELDYMRATMDMNEAGWHVDVSLVKEMIRRYERNVQLAVDSFRIQTEAEELNLSSHPQLVAWCKDKGIIASSFDELSVASMLKRIGKKLEDPTLSDEKRRNYEDVVTLLNTKQILGGSSMKKLYTVQSTVSEDDRLRDQYLHIGAGATWRTTGRGVQMQNLKRLGTQPDPVEDLFDTSIEWSNDKMASNLRQVFTASVPQGRLIVGDFSSVESRGLAWFAGEQWKLEEYRAGADIYKALAAKFYHKDVADITKPERTFGKVGELSCGYGAGPDAVQSFAEKMGVELTEVEAGQLVADWRRINDHTVQFWHGLDRVLHDALVYRIPKYLPFAHGRIRISPVLAPASLRKQVGDQTLLSLRISVFLDDGTQVLSRVIHGTHMVGRSIEYYKPSERKTGDLWTNHYTDPKTKQTRIFTVYGGKLAGLLTQSLCREIFMAALVEITEWAGGYPNVKVVGQFHDEIVLDWIPWADTGQFHTPGLMTTIAVLEDVMTHTSLPGFPLAAEVKSDHRYTK